MRALCRAGFIPYPRVEVGTVDMCDMPLAISTNIRRNRGVHKPHPEGLIVTAPHYDRSL
jgi:hypothetical protein